MSNHNEMRVHLFHLSVAFPFVDVVELNNEVIGYISENRDWNKKEKPVSLVSPEGVHLGDFCCIGHAAAHITEKKTGVSFDEVEVLKSTGTRVFKVEQSSDLLDALMFVLASKLKGKRPH